MAEEATEESTAKKASTGQSRQMNIQDKINNLMIKIDECQYWLSDGRTSNPKTIRNKRAWLKTYQKELNELKRGGGN